MKNSLFRKAIVTSLLAALTAFAIPLNAAPRDRNRDRDDRRYDANCNDRDSYRDSRDWDRDRDDDDRRPYDRAAYSPSYGQPAPRPVYHRDRSTGKSVLIVAGSAATGAAIGGLAGGGKGAGIGAIAGGLGGFIFDRATAHHH